MTAPTSYTVKNGDYLVGIAKKLNVRLADLLAANKLVLTSVITPGQVLVVPAAGTGPAPSPVVAEAPYIVQAGDALVTIAKGQNIKVGVLLKANSLTLTSVITPGQKLVIPGGAKQVLTVAPVAVSGATPATRQAEAPTTPTSTGSSTVDKLISYLTAQVGKPYQFFTAGPDTFDCSGLSKAGYAQIGIDLPHWSVAQSKLGTTVDTATQAIKAGDLIFLYSTSEPTVIKHVGIALSATTWIQAVGLGQTVRTGPIPTARIATVQRLING